MSLITEIHFWIFSWVDWAESEFIQIEFGRWVPDQNRLVVFQSKKMFGSWVEIVSGGTKFCCPLRGMIKQKKWRNEPDDVGVQATNWFWLTWMNFIPTPIQQTLPRGLIIKSDCPRRESLESYSSFNIWNLKYRLFTWNGSWSFSSKVLGKWSEEGMQGVLGKIVELFQSSIVDKLVSSDLIDLGIEKNGEELFLERWEDGVVIAGADIGVVRRG